MPATKTPRKPKFASQSPLIQDSGSTKAPIWIVCDRPFDSDREKGYLYSGGAGYVFRKMLQDAGITEFRLISRRPDLDSPASYRIIENDLNHYKPLIIVALSEVATYLCPSELNVVAKNGKPAPKRTSNLQDYCGSLLRSSKLSYAHYVIPTYDVSHVLATWGEREIITHLDLGKAPSELAYYKQHGTLQPLPKRTLKYEHTFDELVAELEHMTATATIISADIETLYNNKWQPNSYPHTLGLAPRIDFGIAFPLWTWLPKQVAHLFRLLDKIFRSVQIVGQNFINFDQFHLEMLAFSFGMPPEDTLLRHAILWPELPHDLGFMVRQYTREPYHKDSGSGWSMANLKPLLRYNALDACTTLEVFYAQSAEFQNRPHLL